MIQTEASIEIKKSEDHVSMSVIMPIWLKEINANRVEAPLSKIHMPLFGLRTYAINEEIDDAIKEALECFWHASEKFGKGFVKELEGLGWSKEGCSLEFDIREDQSVYEEIFETAEQYSEDLQLLVA